MIPINNNFINKFYIKKPINKCQLDSIKYYDWFIKNTPELMLNCPYCKLGIDTKY